MHLKIHSGEKPNRCNQCDSAFSTRGTLKSHLTTHKCNQCEYSYSRADTLRDHLRTHSGEKIHKCHHCDYTSAHRSGLNLHLKSHLSGEKSIKCNLCDFATFYASSLKIHILKYMVLKGHLNVHSVTISGDTLLRDNRRLIGRSLIILVRQVQNNCD